MQRVQGYKWLNARKKPTTGKAGACAVKRQRLPGLGLRAAPRVPGGRLSVATPPAAHGGSHSGGAWNGPGRAPSRPPTLRARDGRPRPPMAPPPVAAAPGGGEGTRWATHATRERGGGPGHHLGRGPGKAGSPGRDEDNGVGCPTTRRQPDPGPGERDQWRGRRDAARGGRMAADGARGRALPKHCERVWRRQPGRRRESVFTSGSRSGRRLAAFPAARAQARDAGSRPRGGPPAARAPELPLRNACLESVLGPLCRRQGQQHGAKLAPLPRNASPLLHTSPLGVRLCFCFVSSATPGFSLDASLWAPRTQRAQRDAFSRGPEPGRQGDLGVAELRLAFPGEGAGAGVGG